MPPKQVVHIEDKLTQNACSGRPGADPRRRRRTQSPVDVRM